jgi:hypothetical protein
MDRARKARVDRFIVEEIESVPHLEALLLVFNSRSRTWSVEEMAQSLYIQTEIAAKILADLQQRKLIAASDKPGHFLYVSVSADRDDVVQDLDSVYRREVVRISSMIHSKASAGVLDFARAFRIKKDKE